MVCTSPVAPSSQDACSIECLTGKMHALEGKVSDFPTRLESLEQRTDLLEKIFLFVDVDVLNKAITATTMHRCGPPALLPACQVPSYVRGSLASSTCGLVHRTKLEAPMEEPPVEEPQHAAPEPAPEPQDATLAMGESFRCADAVPQAATRAGYPIPSPRVSSTASESHWSAAWPTPVPSPRASSSAMVPPESDSEDIVTLVSAADAGRIELVAKLLDENADPDSRNGDSETALHRAAYWAKKDIVQLLLDANADPSARDKKGKTPMRKSYDNPDIVEALVHARADPNTMDESGRTTLHRSAENGHVDVIDVLVRAGADANIGNMEEETPMHEAANFGQTAALRALLRARGNVDAPDAYGATPLHFAAYGGHACVAKLLVECRADIHKANNDGESPLQSAEQGKKTLVAEILCAHLGELSVESKADTVKSIKDATEHCMEAADMVHAGGN